LTGGNLARSLDPAPNFPDFGAARKGNENMKSWWLSVVAGACLLAMPMSVKGADAQTVEWRGIIYLSNFTTACVQDGWAGNIQGTVRYRPSGLGSNGTSTRLSLFLNFYAINFTQESGRFVSNWRNVRSTVLASIGRPVDNSRVRVTTHIPNNANISGNSPQVRLVGDFRNFDGIPGCDVSFEASMLRR
jgi:hypothetical protein